MKIAHTQPFRRPVSATFKQHGVSLIFAMITVIALSLAAVALIRSVDTGSLVMGNLSFKQDAVLASDEGARLAIKWLSDNLANGVLNSDSTANGYYASDKASLDPTSSNTASSRWIDWKSDSCSGITSSATDKCLTPSSKVTLSSATGVTARYVIIRLCTGTGDPFASGSTLTCAKPLNSSSGTGTTEHDDMNYSRSGYRSSQGLANYFRIIVRTEGGRKTVSYVDTLVHF